MSSSVNDLADPNISNPAPNCPVQTIRCHLQTGC